MSPTSLLILQDVLMAVGAVEAAQPYIDKITAMNAAGASGEDILAATQAMRKASGAKLDADLAAGS